MPPDRVLVIDDEYDVRQICRRGLSKAGYMVAEAASGKEAVALARQEPFDVLLVDIRMPGMDGLETFRAIKEVQSDVLGVVITGYATVSNAVEAVNLGLSGFVLKPFKLQQLQLAVRDALAKRESERNRTRLQTLSPLARLSATLTQGDVDAVLHEVTRVALDVLRGDAAAVGLLNGDEQGVSKNARAGLPALCAVPWAELARLGGPVMVLSNSEGLHAAVGNCLSEANLGCLAVVPLVVHQQTLGVLCVGRARGLSPFSCGDLEALRALGLQAAVVISNAQLFGRVVEEERLREMMQRYLSPRTVQAVLNGKATPGKVGEARWMTVLLADVRDFSGLVEGSAFGSVIQALHEYFSAAVEVISAHQGVVDELSGDEVLASFDRTNGGPDDALRAVRAGLSILARLDDLRASWQERGLPCLDVGIGISSGPVAIGSIGSGERMALVTAGRILNLAARSQAVTRESGLRLIITQRTFEQVGGYLDYRDLGAVRLKGISEPVHLYGVLGLSDKPEGSGLAAGR